MAQIFQYCQPLFQNITIKMFLQNPKTLSQYIIGSIKRKVPTIFETKLKTKLNIKIYPIPTNIIINSPAFPMLPISIILSCTSIISNNSESILETFKINYYFRYNIMLKFNRFPFEFLNRSNLIRFPFALFRPALP